MNEKLWFHSKELRGNDVTVVINENLRITGTLMEYYESNNNIVLQDYIIWERNESGGFEQSESGSLMIVKGHLWKFLMVKKYAKRS